MALFFFLRAKAFPPYKVAVLSLFPHHHLPDHSGARGPAEQVNGARGPKLLDRVRWHLRVKHYSIRTEQAYVDWIRRYILFHQKRHPNEMGA